MSEYVGAAELGFFLIIAAIGFFFIFIIPWLDELDARKRRKKRIEIIA